MSTKRVTHVAVFFVFGLFLFGVVSLPPHSVFADDWGMAPPVASLIRNVQHVIAPLEALVPAPAPSSADQHALLQIQKRSTHLQSVHVPALSLLAVSLSNPPNGLVLSLPNGAEMIASAAASSVSSIAKWVSHIAATVHHWWSQANDALAQIAEPSATLATVNAIVAPAARFAATPPLAHDCSRFAKYAA